MCVRVSAFIVSSQVAAYWSEVLQIFTPGRAVTMCQWSNPTIKDMMTYICHSIEFMSKSPKHRVVKITAEVSMHIN